MLAFMLMLLPASTLAMSMEMDEAAIEVAYLAAVPKLRHLTPDTFGERVNKPDAGVWMVFYGASWCIHCQKLVPEWLKLQDHVQAQGWDSHLQLGKVECEDHRKMCESLGGFPTVMVYKNGVPSPEGEVKNRTYAGLVAEAQRLYEGETAKTAFNLLQEVLQQAGGKASGQKQAENTELVHLKADIFSKLVTAPGSRPWMVMFHAPWVLLLSR